MGTYLRSGEKVKKSHPLRSNATRKSLFEKRLLRSRSFPELPQPILQLAAQH